MSYDATGVHVDMVVRGTPCPVCQAPPGFLCNTEQEPSLTLENGIHTVRYQVAAESLVPIVSPERYAGYVTKRFDCPDCGAVRGDPCREIAFAPRAVSGHDSPVPQEMENGIHPRRYVESLSYSLLPPSHGREEPLVFDKVSAGSQRDRLEELLSGMNERPLGVTLQLIDGLVRDGLYQYDGMLSVDTTADLVKLRKRFRRAAKQAKRMARAMGTGGYRGE